MPRLLLLCRFALVATVLCAAQPAFAQALGSRLDEAEKKLEADIKACRPIDIKDYESLSDDAYRNRQRALKAAASGVPIDSEQINSDSKRASSLLERAKDAASKPCPPPQQKPRAAGPTAKKVEPPPIVSPLAGVFGRPPKSEFEQFEDDADDAMDDLQETMEKCDSDAVKKLIPELEDMAKRAHQIANAAKAAGKFSKVDFLAAAELADDLDEALFYAKRFKCPVRPKAEVPQTQTPPPKTTAPERPSTQPGREKPSEAKPVPPEHNLPEDLFPKTPSQPRSIEPMAAPSPPLSPYDATLLALQNEKRSQYHLPPFRWNPVLASDAMAWAQQLAVMHQLVHAPREGRGIERENLQEGQIGWSAERMIEDWLDEERDLVGGYYPNVARDGDWMHVSHFTQIIWPTTTDVGCGVATGGGHSWLVCRYSPGGNKDGKPVGLPFAGPNFVNEPSVTAVGVEGAGTISGPPQSSAGEPPKLPPASAVIDNANGASALSSRERTELDRLERDSRDQVRLLIDAVTGYNGPAINRILSALRADSKRARSLAAILRSVGRTDAAQQFERAATEIDKMTDDAVDYVNEKLPRWLQGNPPNVYIPERG